MRHKIPFFLLTTLLTCGALTASAQSKASQVLRSLTFEAPQALYHVKGNMANIRKLPNAKAAKLTNSDNWPITVRKGQIIADQGTNSQWVTSTFDDKTGYVSKSVLVKCDDAPISVNYFNNLYSYMGPEYGPEEDPNDFMAWRMAPIKGSSGLFVCQYSNGFWNELMLGKMVGGVLVFKYRVRDAMGPTYSYEDEQLKPIGQYLVEFEKDEQCVDCTEKELWFWPNKTMLVEIPLESWGSSMKALDLSKLTETMVYAIFKEKIEKNEVNYFYLTGWSFSSAFDCNQGIG